jgi:hypothetical protein
LAYGFSPPWWARHGRTENISCSQEAERMPCARWLPPPSPFYSVWAPSLLDSAANIQGQGIFPLSYCTTCQFSLDTPCPDTLRCALSVPLASLSSIKLTIKISLHTQLGKCEVLSSNPSTTKKKKTNHHIDQGPRISYR